jgi:hypothetical protein
LLPGRQVLAVGTQYPYTLASLGLLDVEEVRTGNFRQLFTTPASAVDFRRYQARRELEDGRMAAALDPEREVRRIEGIRGRELSHKEAEEILSRIQQRGAATRKHRRGRQSREASSPLHLEWEMAFKEIRSWHASATAAGQQERVPSTWAMCAEVARDCLPQEFGQDERRATRRVYMALSRI